MDRTKSTLVAGLFLLVACEEVPRNGAAPPADPSPSVTVPFDVATGAPTPTPEDTAVPDAPQAVQARRAVVTRVIDGDTAEVSIGGVEEKVRFIGINTPESTTRHEPYGAEASAYTKQALSGKTIWIETDAELRDRYKRLLAYIWLAQPRTGDAAEVRRSMFNARLLLDGYAQVATYPPNVKYVDVFVPLQREARDAGRGLWSLEAQPKAAPKSNGSCHPSYPDVCIAPPPPDLDCGDVPYKRFRVVGEDPHRFDRDGDGVGCES